MLFPTYGLKKACRALLRLPFFTLISGGLLLSAQNALAATVNGTLEFQVLFENVEDTGGNIVGVDFGDIATSTFADGVYDNDPSNGFIVTSSGDFVTAGVVGGTFISLIDFAFDLSTPGPYASAGSFDFYMTEITPSTGAGTTIGDFTGSGFLVDNSNTYLDTVVDWSFNANTLIIALVGIESTGNPVPVPATVWLFGSALGGLALARKRQRNK